MSLPDLPLIHVDSHLLVLDKPSGLLSVPGRGEDKLDCLASRVQAVFDDALIVHRLDMATSGLLIMARGKAMQSALSRAFASREVDKTYVAQVEGLLDSDHGLIELPLICDWPRRPRQMVCFRHGKHALTGWHRLMADPERQQSRVQLHPHTGRSHQLRVHLQAIGHPILGDELYASETGRAASPRLLLHASALRLRHPASGIWQHWSSPVPF